ncbi:UDP-N-acetylmuramoyl-L-alanyl-D-glutamate--2,6-diaminopimelate ligase [Lentibacillus sp. JNUCC-1]|uniref:UDP-N-acetylmuramoyl-L-alanyl-D-glutamate--2, 6-diaminopimelate ligase n=1 Tax=Lentibacillus sp. JNUCC-1 TaxID=2654513 RepID=UPI0012E7EE8C|nr:UDP-N-acetylmuramoyl-L-alanyl-D-glutamate--2,6-diaminopimelate ligase [Lentibacillus sp. JNUCC-1]MUV39298.1 UDP-N-acetylmuramoyl-L-alanyl-D-glutamate--2,6-diaminopimelate ligase [Lentibacillus sp. JNUCC-1]
MHLSSIVNQLTILNHTGNLDCNISSVTFDSRKVKPGSLFIAIDGFSVDGHRFIQSAVEQGAVAIIVEKDVTLGTNTAIIKVPDSRKAMAMAAVHFFEDPAKNLNMIGVTGTNGKTSVTHFIKAILEANQINTGVIGTMGTIINKKHYNSDRTTPESPDLQALLQKMVRLETSSCIMEVSSHALDLSRVAGITFNTAIFTNLTPDHLELHGTMEAYFQAKAKLFEQTSGFSIINTDDPYGRKLTKQIKKDKLITYGIHQKAHIQATDITYNLNHTKYTVITPIGQIRVTIHLPGEIYVYNSLAAIACAFANGISLETIRSGLDHVSGIKGRFETIYQHENYRVIVDFAHTEDALKQSLITIKPHVRGRLILVFGVYADDSENGRKKRIAMGRTAAEHTDYSIVTLDNPREHNQDMIMKETCDVLKELSTPYTGIKDRETAIRHAIQISNDDDTILLAGKGHETTQILGNKEIPFNEKEIVLDSIKTKEFNQPTY